jgi:hypothetical protein
MRKVIFSLALALSAGGIPAFAQDYFYGAPYAGYYHSSTAAEGALRGMGDLARSAGQYNLATSQAAINLTEAQKKYIDNRDQWTNTYFQMREANRMYRARERGERPSMEDMVRYAQAGKPQQLSPSELDSVTGQINWPALLQDDRFAAHRSDLEKLFLTRAQQGALALEDRSQIRKTTDAMLNELRGLVRDVPQADYIAARRFIESLAFEGTAAPS